MVSEKKAKEIILETYELLFNAAIPEVSFSDLKNNCLTYETHEHDIITVETPLNEQEIRDKRLKYSIDFDAYYLPKEVFNKIVDTQAKKYKLKGYQLNGFYMQTYLGCTPTSSKNRWLEKHPETTINELRIKVKDKYPDITDEELL